MTFFTPSPSPHHIGGGAFLPDAAKLQPPVPLRHWIIGYPDRVRLAINYLDRHHYVDHRCWSLLQPLPKDGLIIPAVPEQVFAYLELNKQFEKLQP